MLLAGPFNVVLVGAGEINFGSREGSWNHSVRLQRKLGLRLRVLALIDPDLDRANKRIKEQTQVLPTAWTDTRAFPDAASAAQALEGANIRLIINGTPPFLRGTMQPGADLDKTLLQAFPSAKAMLIEKPVAALPPTEGGRAELVQLMKEHNRVVGVGYMLRYLKAVATMKKLISENNLVPTCINARYYMAYEHAVKLSWWDKTASCGPVVEQATHFCDLLRYFGGEPILSSIQALTVEHDDLAGKLSKLGFDEEMIKPESRIPRVSSAQWKFEDTGAVGTLCHVVGLHGNTYDTEFELLADGWIFRLKNAYSDCPTLYIRRDGYAEEEVMSFPQDDPFYTEIAAFVDAVDVDGQLYNEGILSSFEDAYRTYEFTWAIRKAGEESRQKAL